MRFLMVEAGGTRYLLPLVRIRRVLSGVRLFPFPGAAPVVAGLAQVGGEPLVVLDLARLAGAEGGGAGADSLVVLAEVGPLETVELAGLQVDEVVDLVEIPPEAIAPLHDGVVSGEGVVDGRAARVLELAAVGEGA